ncbi:MAG: hypothetical protein ABL904_17205 [Hyphomicrobiaceae bacterium]
MTAAISWPSAHLPAAVLLSGYKIDAKFGNIRTDMETGQARQRRRFGSPPSSLPVSWIMSGLQVALFKSWLSAKASNGAAWFNIDLKLADGTASVEARFAGDGVGYTLISPTQDGAHWWKVEAKLEIKDPPPLSSEAVDLMLSIGVDDVLGAQTVAAQLVAVDVIAPWATAFPG